MISTTCGLFSTTCGMISTCWGRVSILLGLKSEILRSGEESRGLQIRATGNHGLQIRDIGRIQIRAIVLQIRDIG